MYYIYHVHQDSTFLPTSVILTLQSLTSLRAQYNIRIRERNQMDSINNSKVESKTKWKKPPRHHQWFTAKKTKSEMEAQGNILKILLIYSSISHLHTGIGSSSQEIHVATPLELQWRNATLRSATTWLRHLQLLGPWAIWQCVQIQQCGHHLLGLIPALYYILSLTLALQMTYSISYKKILLVEQSLGQCRNALTTVMVTHRNASLLQQP